jgi:uncharacterized protein YndB with AHSA1/START domain
MAAKQRSQLPWISSVWVAFGTSGSVIAGADDVAALPQTGEEIAAILAGMRARASIEIERPVERVWEFVAEPANDPQWCPKVRRVEADGPNRWIALHQPVPFRPPERLAVEVVAAEAPRRLGLREEDRSSIFEVEYQLTPTEHGTRFTQLSVFRWPALPRIAQLVLAAGVRRDIKRQVRELKRVLESR